MKFEQNEIVTKQLCLWSVYTRGSIYVIQQLEGGSLVKENLEVYPNLCIF